MRKIVDLRGGEVNFLRGVHFSKGIKSDSGICAGMALTWLTESLQGLLLGSSSRIFIENREVFLRLDLWRKDYILK